jgi:hypothetical protein
LSEAETLFDELLSLQEFYRQFCGSYMKLGDELRRRRGFDDKVAKLVRYFVGLKMLPFQHSTRG